MRASGVTSVAAGSKERWDTVRTLAFAPRRELVARARHLALWGLGWHVVEAGVALVAGVIAGSVALVGFGAD